MWALRAAAVLLLAGIQTRATDGETSEGTSDSSSPPPDQLDWDAGCIAECATDCEREFKTEESICKCIARCPPHDCDETATLMIRVFIENGCRGVAPPATTKSAAVALDELLLEATNGSITETELLDPDAEPEPEAGVETETAEQRDLRKAHELELHQREEKLVMDQWRAEFPGRTHDSIEQFFGAWEGDMVAAEGKLSGAQYNFTALGVVYIKVPVKLPGNLPGIRMKFSTNWARSPHQLDLVHIEHDFNHLPDQPCLFEFTSADQLTIQFPSRHVDEHGKQTARPVRVRAPAMLSGV